VRGPLGSGPRFFWGAHAQHAFDEPCAEGEPTTFVLDIGKANLGEPFGENGIVFNTDGGVRTAATSSHTEANLSAPTTTRATTGTPTTKGVSSAAPSTTTSLYAASPATEAQSCDGKASLLSEGLASHEGGQCHKASLHGEGLAGHNTKATTTTPVVPTAPPDTTPTWPRLLGHKIVLELLIPASTSQRCPRQGPWAPNGTPTAQKVTDRKQIEDESHQPPPLFHPPTPPPWMWAETHKHSVANKLAVQTASTLTCNSTDIGTNTSRHAARAGGPLSPEIANSNSQSLQTTLIMHVNIRGLKSHMAELCAVVRLRDSKPDIICINETFLDASTEYIAPEGYATIGRRDRSHSGDTRRCGGIIVYARAEIANHISLLLTSATCERMWMQLHTENGPYLLCAWYRPPAAGETQSIDSFGTELDTLRSNALGTLVVGDLNVHSQRWLGLSSCNSVEGEHMH
jgi:hypothetical protein